MAFRASNVIPEQAYSGAKGAAYRVATRMAERATAVSGGIDAGALLDILHMLVTAKNELEGYKDTPGILQYAKDQESDQSYNIGAEFNALLALIDDTALWIRAALPTDGNDYVLIYKLVNNRLSPRAFNAAQVAPLVTKLQDISNAVT